MRNRIKELEKKMTTQTATNKDLVELWGLYEDFEDYLDNVPGADTIINRMSSHG
jgi:hypothetical protein